MKIVASGMSGFIGKPLSVKLAQKHELIFLKRLSSAPAPGNWANAVDGADAVINLSGEPIAGKRWTKAQKKELITSRLNTTRALVEAIGKAKNKPHVFINASAIGFYGDRGSLPLQENASAGIGFLPDVCKEWERQAFKAESFGVRTILLRTGVVLGKNGGAMAKMLPPFQLGLGGPLGNGKQYMSWIHLEDEVSAIVHVLENTQIRGPVNLTAPNAVTMGQFAKTLGKVLKRPALFSVPAPVLKILLGEMATMLLEGQNVEPKVLLDSGFHFKFPNLESALNDLV